MTAQPILAVIGGSGLYQFEGLQDVQTIEVDTPYGKPSSPIVMGTLAGKTVAFLARHGIGHFISPTEVNYRANIYALKSIGARRIVSISACGSLREDYAPGHIVIPDQLIDFTRDRKRSFFENGLVAHISPADPFCNEISTEIYQAVIQTSAVCHLGGSLITIEGPRFSTKGESNLFRAWGLSIIGMTTSPEAFLAREAEMCYGVLAHVTDYDVWHSSEAPVSVDMVVRTLQENTHHAQEAIRNLVSALPEDFDCKCSRALANALMTHPPAIPADTRQQLGWLVDKYLS
ncbi:MAG: S-methyl-5'-thioadenosine phosphorylase [Chloroflexi bacterium]|nr:S-methyl-5'-thioadenosine phosphorylase [Chloroflexota bacterium]